MKYKFFETPEYSKLVDLAEKHNIPLGDKSSWDLWKALVDIDCTDTIFKDVSVYKRVFTAQEIDEKTKLKHRIPRNTYFPKSIKREVINLIGENPHAFEGYIFGCADLNTQYTWTNTPKCICGETFKMERVWTDQETKIRRHDDVQIKECPKCNKKWILLK